MLWEGEAPQKLRPFLRGEVECCCCLVQGPDLHTGRFISREKGSASRLNWLLFTVHSQVSQVLGVPIYESHVGHVLVHSPFR